jgi:hypothetical protein
MMRLKGRMAERLPPEKREKMERTLRRMDDIRRTDDMTLREIINEKKAWAEQERQKGYDIITSYDKRISEIEEQKFNIKQQIIKLDGIILGFEDVLAEAGERDTERKKQLADDAQKAAETEATRKANEEAALKAEQEAERMRNLEAELRKKILEQVATENASKKKGKKTKV